MFRRIFLVLSILILLAILGAAVFIATFDADRYRPQLIARLEQLTGKPVALGAVRLEIRKGIAFALEDLALYPGPKDQTRPFLQVHKAACVLSPAALLRRQIRLSEVWFDRPQVRVVLAPSKPRDLQPPGAVSSIQAAPADAQTERLQAQETAGQTERFPFSLDVRKADVHDAELIFVREGEETTLASLRLERLEIAVESFSLGSDGLLPLRGFVRAQGGRLTWPQGAGSLEGMEFEAAVQPSRVEIQRLRAALGSGSIALSAVVDRLTSAEVNAGQGPQADGELRIQDLPLEDVLPPSAARSPRLKGNVTAQGTFHYRMQPAVLPEQSLSGSGTLKLVEGRVENLNVLREVFRRISVIPGLAERLLARLPDSYRDKLEAEQTRFKPVEVALEMDRGGLQIRNLHIASDDFELEGDGNVRLTDRTFEFPAIFRMEPTFTAAVIRSVEELQFLADEHGRLTMPVLISGGLHRLSVTPDLEYVASRLLTTQAEDFLQDLLRKALE